LPSGTPASAVAVAVVAVVASVDCSMSKVLYQSVPLLDCAAAAAAAVASLGGFHSSKQVVC